MVLHKQRFNCRKEPSKKRKAKFWLATSAKSGKEKERILKNFLFFFFFVFHKKEKKKKKSWLSTISFLHVVVIVDEVNECRRCYELWLQNRSWKQIRIGAVLRKTLLFIYLFINNKLKKKKKNSWVWMWICDGVRMRAIEYLLIIINKRKKVPVQHHT